MALLDNLSDLLNRAGSGDAPPAEVHAAYDQVATAVPQGTLAEGISHTFRSDQTPPFEHMVAGLYGHSNPEQKAGLLSRLLGALGPGGLSGALSAAGLGGILSNANVTPQQAQQVPPEAVQVLAGQAAKKDPTIIDKAAGFYAEHPTLVKAIGAGALAMLMSRISAARR